MEICTIMPTRSRLSLEVSRMWLPGQEVTFNFAMGGRRPEERFDEIEEAAMEWTRFANIGLHRIRDKAYAMIRISFDADKGSWSLMGKDCMMTSRLQPTMNFGWIDKNLPSRALRRVVIHEFGHALGCVHEHQNPEGGVPWNVHAVYEYYERTCKWNKAMVDSNILETYDMDMNLSSDFDPSSIMMYPIPQELTMGDYEVGWNTEMSDGDKKFIAKAYPYDD